MAFFSTDVGDFQFCGCFKQMFKTDPNPQVTKETAIPKQTYVMINSTETAEEIINMWQ